MFDTNTPREKKMNAYRFAELPNPSAIGSAVTLLVSAWFLVAGGAILADKHSDRLVRAAQDQRDAAHIDPDARLTIVVEASRPAASL
jgi:hypothetical protein